ncbi:MAG: hypothetical protein M1336_07050 [Deltaproteobacteria bacterium]|jgi:hypothetical protein|nr:hypothetical protein [Deltaproteobacteria bacterium]
MRWSRIAAQLGKLAARFAELFASNIRNQRTRRAYARTIGGFLARCPARGGSVQ